MKLVAVAGIRPQFIKLAALQRAVSSWNKEHPGSIELVSINSGQHYDAELSSTLIDELKVVFDFDLTGNYNSLRPIQILGQMIIDLFELFTKIPKPIDWVLVFGDANSTLAAAIGASKLALPIVHIESGARSGDLSSPEEQNRIVTDHLARVHFVSSRNDILNLQQENKGQRASWVGDIAYDLVLSLSPEIPQGFREYDVSEYILCTLHHQENINSDVVLPNLLRVLNSHKKSVLFVTHPRTRHRIQALSIGDLPNINFIDGLSYKSMLTAIKNAEFVITDSGGVQRECYYLRKRCLVRQKDAFWPVLIEKGIHYLMGETDEDVRQALGWVEKIAYTQDFPIIDDFGDGMAGFQILNTLSNHHQNK